MHKSSMEYAHKSNNNNFDIQKRRQKVSILHAQSLSENDIAKQLGVDQATISRDLKAIKEESNAFVYSLARNDLAFHYEQTLISLREAKRRAWDICNNTNKDTLEVDKVKLKAIQTVIDSDETAFKLLSEGPAVLSMRAMEQRLTELEQDDELQEQQQQQEQSS